MKDENKTKLNKSDIINHQYFKYNCSMRIKPYPNPNKYKYEKYRQTYGSLIVEKSKVVCNNLVMIIKVRCNIIYYYMTKWYRKCWM